MHERGWAPRPGSAAGRYAPKPAIAQQAAFYGAGCPFDDLPKSHASKTASRHRRQDLEWLNQELPRMTRYLHSPLFQAEPSGAWI
jgi:hypothetical protein